MVNEEKILKDATKSDYKYGFVSKFNSETLEVGLNEDIIKKISLKKNEPEWMLN